MLASLRQSRCASSAFAASRSPRTGRAAIAPARARYSLRVRAADMGGMVDTLFTTGILTVSLGAGLFALFADAPRAPPPPATSPPGRRRDAAAPAPPPAKRRVDEEDNFKWAIMGAISCFPLFNSMAWVFGGLDSERPRFWFTFAALYASPLLRNGLDQDWFSWTLLIAGALHMQALRVAATEPETQAELAELLVPLRVVRGVVSGVGRAAVAVTGVGGDDGRRGELPRGGSARRWTDGISVDDNGSSAEDEEEDGLRRAELARFDAEMLQREKERRQDLKRKEI